jgi:uncharacterized membrane protein
MSFRKFPYSRNVTNDNAAILSVVFTVTFENMERRFASDCVFRRRETNFNIFPNPILCYGPRLP